MPERMSDRMPDRLPDRMPDRMVKIPDRIECQNECLKRCQIECQNRCRKEYQNRCHIDVLITEFSAAGTVLLIARVTVNVRFLITRCFGLDCTCPFSRLIRGGSLGGLTMNVLRKCLLSNGGPCLQNNGPPTCHVFLRIPTKIGNIFTSLLKRACVMHCTCVASPCLGQAMRAGICLV